MNTSLMHAFCRLTFRTLNIDLISYRRGRQEIWVQDYWWTYSISDVLTLANIIGTTATAIRTSERKNNQKKNNCLIEQSSNCCVFTLFGTFHCRCCRVYSVKFSNFTFYMHKTKDSVFLFCFSVSLFLDMVVLRVQLRENPSKCNNLNQMEYSHEVSNSVNWLLKWRFRCHRYHYYHRKHPSTRP